jgi:hypothetical protein
MIEMYLIIFTIVSCDFRQTKVNNVITNIKSNKSQSNMHRCDIKSGSFIFTIMPKVSGPLISSANLKSATLRTSIFLKICGPSTNMEISLFAILQTIYLIYGPYTAQLLRIFGDWMRGNSVYSHRIHRDRGEIGDVYLPSLLERTPQLCS